MFDLVTHCFLNTKDGEAPAHHRIAGWDLQGEDEAPVRIVGIISQSDVVRFLHKHESSMPHIASLTVASVLPLSPDAVLSVEEASLAVAAFNLMATHNRSALGVTTPAGGRLVDCISASDLRNLRSSDFGRMALPVAKFLGSAHAPACLLTGESGSAKRLLTVAPSDPLADAVTLLADEAIHHAFVVDPLTEIAVGIITPFDVLRLVAAAK